MELPPSVARVAADLVARGATGTPRLLDTPARTAVEAAAALRCEVGAIANSLVFDAGGTALLVLTSGAHRVATDRLAGRLGLPALDRACPALVRSATGQVIGGVSPVGHPAPLRTVVDRALAAHPVVWAAAGHPHAVFPTSYDELLRLTGGVPSDVD